MKKFSEIVKEYEERENRIVSPVPDIPIDADAGLNDEQAAALKTLQSGTDCFLSGSAGSGKSFVLRRFISGRCEKSVLVTAPTKIAAHHLRGKTLHSVFSVPYEEDGILTPQDCAFDDARWESLSQGEKYRRIHDCDTVIIDEISMVRADVFKWVVSYLRAEEARTGHHIQLILCGDFLQLPPVICTEDREAWRRSYPDNPDGFVFLSQEWRDLNIQTVEIRQNMRQKDKEHAEALEQIRCGDPNGEGRKWIQAHSARERIANVSTLCATKEEVDCINNAELDKLPGDSVDFETYIPEPAKLRERKMLVGRVLRLKPGAPVITLVNDREGRFNNGSRGVVVSIDPDKDIVRVRMDETGQVIDILPYKWRTYTQFPLALAWALTVHKAQGMTCKAVNIYARRAWEAGQIYVSLSRGQEICSMYIDGDLSLLNFEPNRSVVEFYEREARKAEKLAKANAAS